MAARRPPSSAPKSPANSGEPPTGASLFFTSNDRIIQRARKLLDSGKFKRAESLLSAKTSDPLTRQARAEGVEIIRRLRHNYSLDAAGLLEQARLYVPDATASDLEGWTKQSRSRPRTIDGRQCFFRREARNIFLFSAEAKQRREQAGRAPAESAWRLIDHLQAIVDEAERTGRAAVRPVRHKITHTLGIPGSTPGIKAGSLARVWLPFPQEYGRQRAVKLLDASPQPKLIAPSAVEGNPLAGAAQRSIYFERRVGNPAKPMRFTVTYEYVLHAYHPPLDEAQAQPLPPDWQGAYLGERPPHIVFTPSLRRRVAAILGKEKNPLARARQLFRWISANLQWNAEDEYCLIPSFVLKGMAARRGDCGILNTIFITFCRIAGIPARWQSGFMTLPSSPGGGGMHDWSEIYIAPWGWLPVDASTGAYGVQPSADPRIADFYCGHLDSHRTIINLDWGRELFPPKTSLRSEPADFQRGEVEVDGKNLYFDQWDYALDFEVKSEA